MSEVIEAFIEGNLHDLMRSMDEDMEAPYITDFAMVVNLRSLTEGGGNTFVFTREDDPAHRTYGLLCYAAEMVVAADSE